MIAQQREGVIASQDLSNVKGIGPASVRKLAEAGITSVESLCSCKTDDLALLTGFGVGRVNAILASARPLIAANPPAAAKPSKTVSAKPAEMAAVDPPAADLREKKSGKKTKKKKKKSKRGKSKSKPAKVAKKDGSKKKRKKSKKKKKKK